MSTATLERRQVGRTRLEVTTLGLGCAPLAGIYQSLPEPQATETVAAAWESGVRYFDTAPVYGAGLSELRLGRALAGVARNSYVLSSKVGYDLVSLGPGETTWDQFPDGLPYRRTFDFSAEATHRSIEGSLERLGTDRLDVVWIHDPDGADPDGVGHFAAAMTGAYPVLDDLRRQGVVGAVGVGINQSRMLLDFLQEGEFDCFLLAGRFTLLEQGPFDDLLPACLARGVSVVVGGPYNSGILATGAVDGARYDYAPASPHVLERVRRLAAVCAEHGRTLQAAALQYVLRHPAVASVIPGASSPAELRQAVDAVTGAGVEDTGLWDDLRSAGLTHPDSP